ncbi:hypothetical protein TNCT_722681, partial [Trichonephila clavata]
LPSSTQTLSPPIGAELSGVPAPRADISRSSSSCSSPTPRGCNPIGRRPFHPKHFINPRFSGNRTPSADSN